MAPPPITQRACSSFSPHSTTLVAITGTGGRDRLEWLVAMFWTEWSQSTGITGRDQPVRAARRRVAVATTDPTHVSNRLTATLIIDRPSGSVHRSALSSPSPMLGGRC